MERIRKDHSERLPPAKLFIDDIERIFDILSEVSAEVTLVTDEYSLGDVSLLENLHREQLTELEMKSSDPYVSLEMTPNRIWLYITEDTAASRGVFEKIKAVLYSRRRKLYIRGFLAATLVNGLAGGLVVSSPFVLFRGITKTDWLMIGADISLLCISVLWLWWYWLLSLKQYSLIILKRHIEQESFWHRNRDAIMVGAISAVVGTAIGSAMTLLAQALAGRTP